MILLFRGGGYKMFPPDISEAKFIAKFKKYEAKTIAIIFEAFNRLGSDIFTIIQAENFEPKIEPFDVELTTCVVGDDESPHEGNIMSREFHIGGIFDLYSLSTLLYQMLKNYDVSSALNMITGVVILKIAVIKNGKRYEIAPEPDFEMNDHVMDWLKQFGIRCDTDEFLYKKSTKSKDDCVVTMRYNKTDGYVKPSYYWPQERCFLLLYQDHWVKIEEELNYEVMLGYATLGGIVHSGICIPNTGLMYICPMAVGIEFFDADSMEVWYSIYNRKDDVVYISSDLIALNAYDYLYMALYLPQMLDANRYLYQMDPLKIDIEIIKQKFLARRGRYNISVPKDPTEGIQMDMFAMIANVLMNEPLHDIRVESNRSVDDSKLSQLIPQEDQ